MVMSSTIFSLLPFPVAGYIVGVSDLVVVFEFSLFLQIESTGMVWPDNAPLYDVASQMTLALKPSTQFPAMDELARAVNENDTEKVRPCCIV